MLADFTPIGEMLLAMQPVLRIPSPATAGSTTAIDVDPGRRCSKLVRRTTPKVVAAIAILNLAMCVAPAQGQAPDSGGLSSQSPEPVPITPAMRNPGANSTPLEPIFPPANAPVAAAPRSSRYATPTGPSSGAGLGYGPIHPGDIVEVQVFDAPEYSVRMPVSPAGQIAIPYAGLFHIEGMTSIEAAPAIARLFVQQQILRDPRVIVTPHAAFVSRESLENLRSRTSRQVAMYLSGERPENVVNPEVL